MDKRTIVGKIKLVLRILFPVFLFSAIVITIIVNPVLVIRKKNEQTVNPDNIEKDLEMLTSIKPARDSANPESLDVIAGRIYGEFEKIGCRASFQSFDVGAKEYKNVICKMGDKSKETIVIGAHYDVLGEQQGADDNASAVAGMLEIARLSKLIEERLAYQLEFVAYSLEEPPHFRTQQMGSAVHARSLVEEKRDIKLMISLEMIGFYTEEENSQTYSAPWLKWIYPNKGNFIAIVGRFEDYFFTRDVKAAFKETADIETWSLNAPSAFPGIDFSDHLNYWENGMNAVMVTDTAFYRNKNYHEKTDTIDTLDIGKITEVVRGVYSYIESLEP